MDVNVSRKETRYQPSGAVQVLMSDVTDLYPVFVDDAITDIEMLDGDREEALDRGMWAVFKQRGLDPLDLSDGNQIEEAILGEVSPITLMTQMAASVAEVGPGVKSEFGTSVVDGKEYLTVAVSLTNSV